MNYKKSKKRKSRGIRENSKRAAIKNLILVMEKRGRKQIPIEDIILKTEKRGIAKADVRKIINKMLSSGDIFEPKQGFIQNVALDMPEMKKIREILTKKEIKIVRDVIAKELGFYLRSLSFYNRKLEDINVPVDVEGLISILEGNAETLISILGGTELAKERKNIKRKKDVAKKLKRYTRPFLDSINTSLMEDEKMNKKYITRRNDFS